MKHIFLPICLMFFLCACQPSSSSSTEHVPQTTSQKETSPTASAFSTFAEEMFVAWVQTDTLNLHYKLASPSTYDITHTEISLGSLSPSAQKGQYLKIQENLEALYEMDYNSLSSAEQFSYDVLEDYLLTQLKLEEFLLYEEPLGATLGIQAQLPILLSEYAFQRETDIQHYLLLLESIDDYFLSILDFEQQKKEAGLFMENSCLEQIVTQCHSFCETEEEHLLIASFQERMDTLPFSLSSEKKQTYKKQNQQIMEETVLPAYEMLADGLLQLKDSCQYPGGLCQKPKGQEYYSLLVYKNTGSSKTVTELFEQTKQRIAQNLLSIATLYQEDSNLSQQLSDYGFSLSDPTAILNYLQDEILSDFPSIPEDSFTVKYVPDALTSFTSPAFYLIPPIDDSSRNIIYLNTTSGLEANRLFPILAHEGYPGHLYQHTWFSSVNPYPIRELLSYPGYTEGWATYSELYAYHLEDSFSSNLSSLLVKTQETTLGIYSLMDMGVHYYGWTTKELEETISTYFGISDSDIAHSIYKSLLESPANYLSYYIGYTELLELKEYAIQKWGETFSLQQFHKKILDLGPAPFYLIKEQL